MRNKEFNKSQQKVNLRVSVHQKDGHRLNSQKNPLMAAVVKMLLSGLDNGTECSFN
jgi:hypothetical protein